MRIAVFPGSFDPITLGHVSIIKRGLEIFDRLIIGIGNNAEKKYMFSAASRENWIKKIFENESRLDVEVYEGLTIDFCTKVNAAFILRGLRTSADFEFEKAIAHMNAAMNKNIETVFLLSELKYGALSSSIVLRNGGDARQFLPGTVKY
jgi:pantetheine-phosphate adenylyltransferase